jgi:hypothetical protein
MPNDIGRAGAKSASRTEWSCERANNEIYSFRIHVLGFRESATIAAEDAKRVGLIEGKAELVLFLEFNLDHVSAGYTL